MSSQVITRHLWRGCRVAVADGVGAPVALHAALTEAAAAVGGVELLLGWCFELPVDVDDAGAFPAVRTFMGGYALRRPIAAGRVGYVPARLGALPALVSGPLRPDVVVLSARPTRHGFAYTTEVAWLPAAVEAAETVLVHVNRALPAASGEQKLPRDRVVVAGESQRPPYTMAPVALDDASRAIGAHVARLVPENAAIQFGPGRVADAALAALDVPVHVDSGVVTDAVVDLDARGLLRSPPSAAYLTGGQKLYDWADGRPIARRIEFTHDVGRLSSRPFVAINTALEVDAYGQANVERAGDDPIGGVGGHGDYALAASRSAGGLSLLALPLRRGDHPTLVGALSGPTSTAYADVDVVVTEHGVADVRGLPSAERATAIASLWRE